MLLPWFVIIIYKINFAHGPPSAYIFRGLVVRFTTTSGVRQGCVFAPALFCRAIDWIMEHMSGLKGVTMGRHTIKDLDYADDIALPASHLSNFETCLSGLSLNMS